MRRHAAWMICLAVLVAMVGLGGCPNDGPSDNGGNGSGPGPEPGTAPPGKGYALAIGLNEVDPAHYGGWDGALTGCEPDVEVMKTIAEGAGFETETLLTRDATREKVLDRLSALAEKLEAGDHLVVSYSGHGGNVIDQNGDESDSLDETWVLYDGQLIDDELAQAWSKFREGVRILLLSDSCHSGTVLKFGPAGPGSTVPVMMALSDKWKETSRPKLENEVEILELPEMKRIAEASELLRTRLERRRMRPRGPLESAAADDDEPGLFVVRAMPPDVAVKTFNANVDFYKAKGSQAPKESDVDIKAAVILVSGCRDDQYSMDLGFNGLFTHKLKGVWSDGAFEGTHAEFHEKVRDAVMASEQTQTPQYNTTGKADPKFADAKPYTIAN